MANNQALQILRGAKNYNPSNIEEKLLDGQLFYSKCNKQLYIGDNANYEEKSISEILPIGASNLIATSNSALKQLSATEASGINSVAFGEQTTASAKNGAVFGQYNFPFDDALFTIGDGTSENNKHNALNITKDTDGNVNKFEFAIENDALVFEKTDASTSLKLTTNKNNANYPLLKIESSGDTALRNKNFYFYTSETGNDAAIAISSDTEGSSSLPRIDVTANELIVRTDKYTGDSTAAISLVQNTSGSKLTINGFTEFVGDALLTNSTLTATNLKADNNITTPKIIVGNIEGNQTIIDNGSISGQSISVGSITGNSIIIDKTIEITTNNEGKIYAPTISTNKLDLGDDKSTGGHVVNGINLNLDQAETVKERPLYVAAAFTDEASKITKVYNSHPSYTNIDQLSFTPASADDPTSAILKVGGTIQANELCIVDNNQTETTLSGIVSNLNGRLDSLGFNCGDVSIIDGLSPITAEKSLTITSPDTAEQIKVNPDCYAVKIGKLVGISLKLQTAQYVNNTQIAAAGAAIATLPQDFPIPNNEVTIEAISRIYTSRSQSAGQSTTTNTNYYKSNFTIKQDEITKEIKIYTQELLKIETGGSAGGSGGSTWSLKPYIILNCWYLSQ